MSTFNVIKQTILSGGIEEYEYKSIQDEFSSSNRRIVLIFSIVAGSFLAVLFAASFFVGSLSAYRWLYGAGFFLSAVIWYIAQYPGRSNSGLMTADVYLFCAMLLAIGIALGTFLSPAEISATFIALLLAVPQVFTDRPWRMYLLILISDIVFIILSRVCKDASTASSDITNAIVFGVCSVALCTFSIRTRVSKYYLQYRIRFLAETDQLTGLKNRYSYQKSLDEAFILNSSSIYCVYVDANGLHELNDTQGHEAGDRMLQYIADAMRHLFGKDETYRIGGDVFVALGLNKDEATVNELVSSLKQAVESAGYHIAAGVCVKGNKELAVNSMIKDAETEMYADKAAFYQQSGKDRRRRS